jgi:hypothetical protein
MLLDLNHEDGVPEIISQTVGGGERMGHFGGPE